VGFVVVAGAEGGGGVWLRPHVHDCSRWSSSRELVAVMLCVVAGLLQSYCALLQRHVRDSLRGVAPPSAPCVVSCVLVVVLHVYYCS